MWKMLISNEGELKIDTSDIKADEYVDQLDRSYSFKLIAINIIHSRFHFQDGLIVKHIDDFDVWKWSKRFGNKRSFIRLDWL
jgi:hypothetical protein